MKRILAAAIVALGLPGAGEAATRTFEAVFTDLTNYDGALEALGADPTASEMVFTWSFDTDEPPLLGPMLISGPLYMFENVYLAYQTFSASVGGVSIDLTPVTSSTSEAIYMIDAVADGTIDIGDHFEIDRVYSFAGPNGSTIQSGRVRLRSLTDETVFSGSSHPSAEELNELDDVFGGLYLLKSDGTRASVRSNSVTVTELTEVAAVPLPAAMPLFLSGILALGLVFRSRSTF